MAIRIKKTAESLFKKYPSVMFKKDERWEVNDGGRALNRFGSKKEAEKWVSNLKKKKRR